MRRVVHAALAVALLLALTPPAPARQDSQPRDDEEGVLRAPLSELRDARRTLLVVSRMFAVDTRGPVRSVIDELFGDPPRTQPRHQYAYDLVAKRLDKYAAETRGLSVVETAEEAELIIVYKVVRQMRSFSKDEPFVYGEMFVFLNRGPGEREPALVWRTKDDDASPEAAVKEFVKQLKAMRGEK